MGPHHVGGDEVPQGHRGDEGGQEAPGEEDNPVVGQHAQCVLCGVVCSRLIMVGMFSVQYMSYKIFRETF